jgi:hypothetical protein
MDHQRQFTKQILVAPLSPKFFTNSTSSAITAVVLKISWPVMALLAFTLIATEEGPVFTT